MDSKVALKVGLFGGSFDPIHFGHLNLAIEMLEKHGLDKVLFCPARQNPLKNPSETPQHHRLEMLRLAIAPVPQFEVTTIELEREGPSYTVDTIEELARQYQNLFLIIGEDSRSEFHKWKDWQRIEQMATLLAGPRECSTKATSPYRILEISSTELRERLSKGLYCEHLIPKNVLDYIHTHQLYLTSNYG